MTCAISNRLPFTHFALVLHHGASFFIIYYLIHVELVQFVPIAVEEDDEDVSVSKHLCGQREIQVDCRQNNEVQRLEDNVVYTRQRVADDSVDAVVPLSNQANAFEDGQPDKANHKTHRRSLHEVKHSLIRAVRQSLLDTDYAPMTQIEQRREKEDKHGEENSDAKVSLPEQGNIVLRRHVITEKRVANPDKERQAPDTQVDQLVASLFTLRRQMLIDCELIQVL